MKRFEPLPLLHPGGVQPYTQAGGRAPGPALNAMLAGSTLFGQNPMDIQRAAQKGAGKRPPSLLDPALLSVIDGGASASDAYDNRKDKGIFGPKRHQQKTHPVPLPQWQPRRKDVPA